MVTKAGQANSAPRRSYRSSLRAEQARQTRERVLVAAGQCFAENGYATTSLRSIAARAGVSVETVQLNGPKVDLLLAASELAFAGEEGRHSLLEREAFRRILELRDPARILAEVAEFFTTANAASARLMAAFEAAAQSDQRVAVVRAGLDQRARADALAGVELFASLGAPLLPGRTHQQVADEVWFLAMPHHYLRLVEDAGWSPTDYREWLHRGLRAVVLGPPAS